MKNVKMPNSFKKGITLIEMSIVILTILILIGIAVPSGRWINGWKLGKQASEDLRAVYAAQRMFLSDNPLRAVTSLLPAEIAPYLPPTYANRVILPILSSIEAVNDLTINVARTPPIVTRGVIPYDPSGNTADGLWDVGQP